MEAKWLYRSAILGQIFLLAFCGGCNLAHQRQEVMEPARSHSTLGTKPTNGSDIPEVHIATYSNDAHTDVKPTGGIHTPELNLSDTVSGETHPLKQTQHVVFASAVLALDETDNITTLDSLIRLALSVHPSIQAARQKASALRHRIPQVTALEDPTFGNTFWPIQDQALQTAGGRVGHQFSIGQKVPWPEKIKVKERVAQKEVEIAETEVIQVEQEITEAVRLAYYQLWLTDHLIQVVQQNKLLVEDLIKIAEARYRTGGSQSDLLKAQIESDKLDEELIHLLQEKEVARADLGTLVQQPAHLMPTAVSELELISAIPDLKVLIAEAEKSNPNLQGLRAQLDRDREKIHLASLQRYPDFHLGVGYSIISDDQNVISPVANGRDNLNFSVGLSLPLWKEKNESGVSEAIHHRNRQTHLRDAEHNRLIGQIRRQVAAAEASVDQLHLFVDRLIPKTERTLRLTTADYQGKKADFSDLIENYQDLLSYQIQVARAKADIASTHAKIARLVGKQVK